MYQMRSIRIVSTLLVVPSVLNLLFIPLTANAQVNICEFSDAACSSPKSIGTPCPCLVPGSEPPIIPGTCIAVNDCQANVSAVIAAFAAAHPFITAGIVGGVVSILPSLFGGSGGSEGPSQSFEGGLATASLAPPDLTSTETSIPSTISSANAAKNAQFDDLIAGVKTADLSKVSVANVATTPSMLCSSTQSSISKEVDALKQVLNQPCLQI